MLLRLPNAPARLAVAILAIALAATLAYSSIRNARAVLEVSLGTRHGYETAAWLEPDNAENWYLLGRYWQYTLDEPDATHAIQNYRHSLSLNPNSADTWLDLAAVYESEGNLDSARDAFLHARSAYPFSAAVSWRYGNFLLRQNEIPGAFAEIRNAVYADPKRSAEAFSRSWRVAPDVNSILDTVLPPNRDGYLAVIRELGADDQFSAALTVWHRLVAIQPSLRLSDAIPFADLLIQKQHIGDARGVWNDALRLSNIQQNLDPAGSVLWDGGFETGVNGGGFAWFFPFPSSGVRTGYDPRQRHSGKYSLRVTFDGRHNPNFDGVCTNAEVRPETTYRLSAWVRTQSLTSDQGVRVRLSWHAESRTGSFLNTNDVLGTQPWTPLEIPWTSGKDVRYARVCVLRNASAKFDSQIQGTAWIDDVTLIPDTSANSRP
jgi:tetratricopeptide (TPR) repeat protein